MAVKFGEGFVPIGLRWQGFSQQLAAVHRVFEGAMAKMDAVAAKAKWVGILGGGAMTVAVRSAASFEQGMQRVKALTGATGAEFDALSDKAKELGRTTMFSARQSAEAMSFLALAGFDAKKIIDSMGPTLDLAAAGQMDVAQAADIVAKIMAGMGLEANELAGTVDVLAKAFTTSNTDLTQLGEALKYVGPVGKAAGKDLSELVAAIQTMSNAGIQGAMAGTSLRNIVTRLTGSTKETNKVFKSLGVEMTDAAGGMRPLADIVDDLNAKMANLGEAERVGMVMTAFGQRAGPGMSALLAEGGDALRELQGRLGDAGGTAKHIADVQMEGLSGSMTKFKSALEGLQIVAGNELLPVLTQYTEKLTLLTSKAAEADYATRRQAVGVAEVVAKWTALLYLAPKLASAIGGVASAFGAAAGPAGALLGIVGSLAAMSWAEAIASGKSYGEVLDQNLKKMLGLRDAQREIVDDQAKLKGGEYAAAKARDVARETGVGSVASVEAADKAYEATKRDLQRATKKRDDLIAKQETQWGRDVLMKRHAPIIATATTRVREAEYNRSKAHVASGLQRYGSFAGAMTSGMGQPFRDLAGGMETAFASAIRKAKGEAGFGEVASSFGQSALGSLYGLQSLPATLRQLGGGMGEWYQMNRGNLGAQLNAATQTPAQGPQFMGAAAYHRYVQQGSSERLDKTRNTLLKEGNETMEKLETTMKEFPQKVRELLGLGT